MIVMENLLYIYAHKYILEIMMNVAKQAYWRLIFDTASPEVNTSTKEEGIFFMPIMHLLEVSAHENWFSTARQFIHYISYICIA